MEQTKKTPEGVIVRGKTGTGWRVKVETHFLNQRLVRQGGEAYPDWDVHHRTYRTQREAFLKIAEAIAEGATVRHGALVTRRVG